MERERKIKVLSLVALIVAVVGLTVAFAAMSRTLTINGTAEVDAATWDVHFETLDGSANPIYGRGKLYTMDFPDLSELAESSPVIPAVLSEDKTKVEGFGVVLFAPGDYVSFDLKIVNEGTIDAAITSIVNNTPTFGLFSEVSQDENGNFIANGTPSEEDMEIYNNYVSYTVTYTDTGEELKKGDIVKQGESEAITITVKIDRAAPSVAKDLFIGDLGTQIVYTQN